VAARGALDAFVQGAERRIDLTRVNGRTFGKIASLRLYGAIVRSRHTRPVMKEGGPGDLSSR
jgi:hypothetical protein